MAKTKREVIRQCIACRTKRDQRSMLRVVAPPDTETMMVDREGKLNGRGAYVCADPNCIHKAITIGAFKRHLKRQVPDDLEEQLNAAREAKLESERIPRKIRLKAGIKPPEME